MAGYSPSTQAFLERCSLQAITLYYLRDDEVKLLEHEKPGAQLAWKKIVQRDRPAAPAVPFLFKPENYRSEPALKQPSSSDSSRTQRSATRVPRAWAGLPVGAHRQPDQSRSDASKRSAAAQRALDLVKTWPEGDHARARQELSAGDLLGWERRFLDTFAAGASVAVRVAFFLNLEKWGKTTGVNIWCMSWGDVEKYMWAPSRKDRVAPSTARSRFHTLAWPRRYWRFPVDPAVGHPQQLNQRG